MTPTVERIEALRQELQHARAQEHRLSLALRRAHTKAEQASADYVQAVIDAGLGRSSRPELGIECVGWIAR